MRRKLTITVSDEVYRALHEQAGRGSIGGFIEHHVRPHVAPDDADLERQYREAALDEAAEREAMEWIGADLAKCLP